jgi:hypothetical protein
MYLDPGFGSMVIQVVIGLIAAGGVALYTLRQKITKLFGRSSKEDDADEAEHEQGKLKNDKDE